MEAWLEPLFDAQGMREADAWAIEGQGVPSLDLMEAAGAAVAEAVRDVARSGPVRLVCGKGNNAGDGLVAARHLAETGYDVQALLLWPASELSADASANLARLAGEAREVTPDRLAEELAGSGAVVDAIFGTGFTGAPRAPADAAIAAINSSGAPVVATDAPSGVDASTGEVAGAAVEADLTVSFHAAKLGHWVAPGKWHVGELRVAEIGIPAGAPASASAGLIGPAILELAPRRGPRSTKFSSGQVLVVGGSRGLTGAVCMAAQAATRAGAGYATVAVPADLEPIFEAKLTEVMSVACGGPPGRLGPAAVEQVAGAAARAGAVVLGPGLGREPDSFEFARALAARVEAPLVVDADGLNALAWGMEPLRERRAPAILTPHAGELARLLDAESEEVSAGRVRSAREAAERGGAIVVLKGDDTIVCEPGRGGRVAVNGLASAGLATAGSGDVLAGLLGALLARGLEPFAAACAAVYAHARAGRIAAEHLGAAESVIATDVIAALPRALLPEGHG